MKTTHYFPACGFSFRPVVTRASRPVFRFSSSLHRTEEIPRAEAARMIRAARRITRAL